MTGPDGYRTHLMFQTGMPELRNDEVPYDFKVECAKAQHIPKEAFELSPA